MMGSDRMSEAAGELLTRRLEQRKTEVSLAQVSECAHEGRIEAPRPNPHRYYRHCMALLALLLLCGGIDLCSSDAGARGRRDLPPDSGRGEDGEAAGEGTSGQAAGFTTEDENTLRTYVDHVRSPGCSDVPSVAVAVVRPGGSTVTWAAGYSDVHGGVEANDQTHYCVASLSKAFTATLLAQLLDRKRKSLDVSVMSILGGKYPFMEEYVSRHVTVRDLLLHRTGIPRYDYLWISGADDSSAIFRRLRCMKHSKEFRTAALYNNILYALAGHVAEEVGKASWETLVQRELLEPLGMTSTTFIREIYSGPYNVSKARQYVWHNGTTLDIGDPIYRGASDISPAIGVYSTARDMAIWIEFHLERGKNRAGHQLIPKHVMEDMHRGQVSAEEMMKPELRGRDGELVLGYNMYGLGWYTGYQRGHRVLMHFGSYPGYYSMITLLPDRGFGIFSSINGGKMELPYAINSRIHTRAIDLALDVPDGVSVDQSSPCPPSPDLSREAPVTYAPYDCSKELGKYTIPQRHLSKYTGTYASPAYGNITLVVDEGTMWMLYNKIRFLAFPLTDLNFCVVAKDKEQKAIFFPRNISFYFNASDVIEHISVSFLDFDNKFYRLSPDVVYDDWLDTMCGVKPPSCEKSEPLTEVGNAASLTPQICTLFIVFILGLLV